MTTIPLLDLKAQYATIRDEVRAAVDAVLESQHFILGPVLEDFETRCAHAIGVRHAIGVSSGTDALLVALMAGGIGPGDEVITSPYTFFASAGSIARLGARPVFVDIDPVTYCLQPDQVAARVNAHTKAIMPVHLYGRLADMLPLRALAAERGLVIVEDAAQAIGAARDGLQAGAWGGYGCFSFFPSKNLGGAGDGGLVTTDDDAGAERVRILRVHGMQPKYFHRIIGGNFRLDALQAAVLLAKLPHLEAWTTRRQANAARYDRLFRDAGLAAPAGPVGLPAAGAGRHVFNQYVIRVPRRDTLMAFLKAQQIGCEVYYPLALHMQACFATLGYRAGAFPESERAACETLAIPVYPELTDDQAGTVVAAIGTFFAGR